MSFSHNFKTFTTEQEKTDFINENNFEFTCTMTSFDGKLTLMYK